MEIKLKDERLNKRWLVLVRSQMKVASALAAGAEGMPGVTKAFAATQAAWRFYNNERISLAELIEPIRGYVREQVGVSTAPFVLMAHDWCKLSFPGQSSRKDVTELSSSTDVGYELTTSLAIDADRGTPLGPCPMHMKTADGLLSTVAPAPAVVSHLEQILPTMEASRGWNLARPIVILDRPARTLVRGKHGKSKQISVPGPPLAMRLILTTELKTVLVRLSGRQMKRHRPFTPPALLAGLWSLLAMLNTLETYSASALQALLRKVRLPVPLIDSL